LCYRTDDRLGRTMDPLRTIARAWEELTEGWRQLLSRNSNALTHFVSGARKDPKAGSAPDFPQWGLLAAETWETAGTLIVRIEVPGMDKDDFDVSIHGNTLRIRGEKRSEDNHHERKYHLMERAYGRFERNFSLPQNVDRDKAEVSYRNGILTVILAKTEAIPPKQLPLQ
jgi:HSP20 family protein